MLAAAAAARVDQNKIPSRPVDRSKKLQDYRLQRNLNKLKTIQHQKVPFFNVVPSGVWLDRADNAPRRALSSVNLDESPVRQILMKPRSVRRSTVNKVLQHSAKKTVKPRKVVLKAPKSRETKVFQFDASPSPAVQSTSPQDVNLPETPVTHNFGHSSSLFRIEERDSEAHTSHTETEFEQVETPVNGEQAQLTDDESEPETPQTETESETSQTKFNLSNKPEIMPTEESGETTELNSSSSTFVVGRNSVENSFTILAPITSANERVERESAPPEMFSDYKNRLSMRIQTLMAMMDTIEFGENSDKLTETQKLKLQQTKFLVMETEKRFDSFLRQYETATEKNLDSTSFMTEEDIDNYWYLFCEEVENLKKKISDIETLDAADEESNRTMKRGRRRKKKEETNSERKRQSMRLINTGTPKR